MLVNVYNQTGREAQGLLLQYERHFSFLLILSQRSKSPNPEQAHASMLSHVEQDILKTIGYIVQAG